MTPTVGTFHTISSEEVRRIVELERLRCVGVVLAEVGRRRLSGDHAIADVLDAVALLMEHPEMSGC